MRLLLTGLVFVASLAAVVLVHAPRAHAGWSAPVTVGKGEQPRARYSPEGHHVALVRGRRILVLHDGRLRSTVRVPRPGRLAGYDLDGRGGVVALRLDERGRRLLALVEGRWRRISPRGGTPVDPKLAVDPVGAAAVSWVQYVGIRVFVYATTRGPNARRFGPAERISGPVRRGGQLLSVGVDPAGDAVATFVENRDLYLWRLGLPAMRIHDATDVVASAFAASSAVAGNVAVAGFTRLEDREPPRYRATVASQTGEEPPTTQTVAEDVSAIDVLVDRLGIVYTSPVGPPHRIDTFPGRDSWLTTAAPSSLDADGTGAIAWTEGVNGFASAHKQTLPLGRAYAVDVAAGPEGRAIAAWDAGPRRSASYAVFTP